MRKKIALLGSTGSIGRQTLEVIRSLNKNSKHFTVVALAAGENIKLLAEQIREFKPLLVSIKNKEVLDLLQRELGGQKVKLLHGEAGLKEIAACQEADLVINGLVGAIGLLPTLEAIKAGKNIGLANKESLVIGGHLIREELKQSNSRIIPIDSEHSAIFQLLQAACRISNGDEVLRIILTASGGALRNRPLEELDTVTPEEVLAHPNWEMGPRITVDSATLVNKGFEVIEAHWLFDMPYDQIEVLIHPQAVVHGLIELKDGSIIGQMSYPDMRIPIKYALTYPDRSKISGSTLNLNLKGLALTFAEVDPQRYPAFRYIVEAGKVGGTLPAALNAADEVLVEKFLKREIRFTDIARGLEKVFYAHEVSPEPDLAGVLSADRWAREYLRGTDR